MSKLDTTAVLLGIMMIAPGLMAQGDMSTTPTAGTDQSQSATTQPSMTTHGKESPEYRRGKAMERAGMQLVKEGQKMIDDGEATDGKKLQDTGRKLEKEGSKIEKTGMTTGTTQQPQ